MQDFVTFMASMLSTICDFLLSEPIIWFVGIFLLSAVAGFVFKILYHR